MWMLPEQRKNKMPEFTQENRIIEIITPLGKDELLLTGFNGQEGISRLFQFDLRMMSENRSIKFEDIVGKKVTVKVLLPDGEPRHINGVISSFAQGGSSMLEDGDKPTVFSHYHATMIPWLWFLTQTRDSRIFQEMSVPDILEKVFKDYGFSDYEIRLQGNYEQREYCVQYRESAFNFVSRLMEEEGIFYFFDHEADKHKLVLADSPNAFKPCPLQEMVSYKSIIGQERDDDVVTDFTMSREIRPGQYTLRDFNFEKPAVDLTSNLSGKGDSNFEIYDYPGEFKTKNEAERLVGIRIQEEDTPQVIVNGASTCRGLVAGFRFDLRDHYRRDFNKSYVLTSIQHSMDLGESWYAEGGDTGIEYNNTFQAIAHPSPFRPLRTALVPVIHGTQTAMVVGKSGEEIWTDKYGRVKVQFHWDREGQYDEKSSCWVRVSSNWAGKNWGFISIPRIGQEVIVDFLEGNPDNPIIVGRVYNAGSMPPYTLPDEQTKSTMKTLSSKGGGGFNEIRFEDKKGEEQLFIHAEKDTDFRVKNDQKEIIGRDTHLIVKRDKFEKTERDEHLVVTRDRIEELGRDHNLTIKGKQAMKVTSSQSVEVSGNVAHKIGGNLSEAVTGSVHIKGQTIVIEGTSGITLSVGGNFITISPAGVMIQGTMVMINSGGAALPGIPGMLVSPQSPKAAVEADKADPGESDEFKKTLLAKKSSSNNSLASDAPTHNSESEENKEKTHFIEIEFTNEAGEPLAGEVYQITLPDGVTLATGTTDEKGKARISGIDAGSCKITFPNLDAEAWGE